ncbi:MAG: oligosaccharide flippase family protein [Saprospiraceae bacterium]|nr:oligosaccharide flippase family protein [Saprospiraceae bacterium]MCZ2337296.1 oligosaccharide flippase family protein [Chitinophagales bacterium]
MNIGIVRRLKNILNDIVTVYQYYFVVRYIVSFLVSVIMVRSALPQTDLGYYELMIFVVVSISAFWSAGLKNALFSYYHSAEEGEKKSLFITVFHLLTLFSAIGILLLLSIPNLLDVFSASFLEPYKGWMAVYLFLSVPIILIESILYLGNERLKLFKYTHWSQGGILILTLITAVFSPELQWYIYILLFWSFIRYVYLVVVIFQGNIFTFHHVQIKTFLIYSIPLILNMLLGSIMDMIDGLFVAHFFDESYFPVFRYGAREMPLSSLLYSSLSIAMVPLISQNINNLDILKKKVIGHLHLLAPLSLILMMVAPFIFPLVYDDQYRDSGFIFNIYLLILISRVLLPQTICLALHQHKIIVISSIIEIIANIFLSFWWMQYWGVLGLALGTVVAYMIQKIVLMLYIWRKNGISPGQYIDLKIYGFYTIAMIIFYILSYMIYT